MVKFLLQGVQSVKGKKGIEQRKNVRGGGRKREREHSWSRSEMCLQTMIDYQVLKRMNEKNV